MSAERIPKVSEVAENALMAGYPVPVRVAMARRAVAAMRCRQAAMGIDELVALEVAQYELGSLRVAINLTGIVLHTGLGRARLSSFAARRVADVAAHHALLEIDADTGKRGDRQLHVSGLLQSITGAEAALAVNNGAAALLLVLRALCAGREVMLSRGQMVEIGGSFRMPDMIDEAGCRLVEVGCTNKTRLSDYRERLNSETAAILRCHPSNYRIVGFTDEPSPDALGVMCRNGGILLIDDVGSGMVDDDLGLEGVERLREACQWADVVVASGDKLLGGPQAGLILGKGPLIDQIKQHPLARAVRIDKLCLAALEATLQQIASGDDDRPVRHAILRPLDEIHHAAQQLADTWPGASVASVVGSVGGGSAPGQELASFAACLPTDQPDLLLKRLRSGRPAIVGRIAHGEVLLDPRCATDLEVEQAAKVLQCLAEESRHE